MAALLFLGGGGEVILILALVLILLGAKKLPEMAEGFRQGITEFRKATREVTDELAKRFGWERPIQPPSHPVLIAVSFVLGITCFILLIYEVSR
ncbi:MAG TPA: twin-arginine translocase TatA/TatE family subunit [Verrucomicrobiae bacterium]